MPRKKDPYYCPELDIDVMKEVQDQRLIAAQDNLVIDGPLMEEEHVVLEELTTKLVIDEALKEEEPTYSLGIY